MKIEGISQLQNVSNVQKIQNFQTQNTNKNSSVSFKDYLLSAMSSMNNQQVEVTNLQQKVITDPDSVDIHDVTIAMAKAQSSLSLAQNVIDRLVKGWSEITTTR